MPVQKEHEETRIEQSDRLDKLARDVDVLTAHLPDAEYITFIQKLSLRRPVRQPIRQGMPMQTGPVPPQLAQAGTLIQR